jgi:hypothetical protein
VIVVQWDALPLIADPKSTVFRGLSGGKSRDGFDDASAPSNRLLSQMIIISHAGGINSIWPVES